MKNNNTIHFKELCNVVYVKKAHKSEKSGSYSYLIVFVYDRQVYKAYYKLDCFLANSLICNSGDTIPVCYIDWYYHSDTKKVNIMDIRK